MRCAKLLAKEAKFKILVPGAGPKKRAAPKSEGGGPKKKAKAKAKGKA